MAWTQFDHTEGGLKKMKVRRYLTKVNGRWAKFPIISFVNKEKCPVCFEYIKDTKNSDKKIG